MLKRFLLKNHNLETFIPWVFFVLFYGVTQQSMLIGSLGALGLTILLNFNPLKEGYILPWGSTILFIFLVSNNLGGFITLQPIDTLKLIHSSLALFVCLSLILGETDSSIKTNKILMWIWALLMILMALPSYLLTYEDIQKSWFLSYGLLALRIIVGAQCGRKLPKLVREK